MADVTEKALRATLLKIVKEKKYENYKLEIEPTSSGGANYSSRLFAGMISAPNHSDLKWFGKVAVIHEKHRQDVAQVYQIEQYAYTHLLCVFQDIEKRYEVSDEYRLCVPELYGYQDVSPREVLVLEDLTAQGFVTHDRLIPFDWKYAAAAVQQLAIFHALSLSMQHSYPKEHAKTLEIFERGVSIISAPMAQNVQLSVERAVNLVREENRARVLNYLGDMKKISTDVYLPSKKPVIAHGDFRMSNILHKIDENEKIKLYLLDYQTLHMGSVVNDLLYFIATGSDAKFRKSYYHRLLDHYYEQLELALGRLQLDPAKVYSREDFDEELKEKFKNLLVYAMYTLPIVTVEEKDAPLLDDELEMATIMKAKPSALCVHRLNEFVDDFIKWGVL